MQAVAFLTDVKMFDKGYNSERGPTYQSPANNDNYRGGSLQNDHKGETSEATTPTIPIGNNDHGNGRADEPLQSIISRRTTMGT
jgi:hypothetical protein